MDIKSGCFFSVCLSDIFYFRHLHLTNPEEFPEVLLKSLYLCIPTLICLNKSSGRDVRPSCWAMLRSGFGLLNTSTQERAALGSSPGQVSKQGPGASWHLFYLKICQQQKWAGYQSRRWRLFSFFYSWLILRMVWPIYCIPCPPAVGSGYQRKKAARNAQVHLGLSPFLKWLPSETTFNRTVLSGTLFLTGTILQVCKTISVIRYQCQTTTVQNTTARWWNGRTTTVSHKKLGPLPPMSGVGCPCRGVEHVHDQEGVQRPGARQSQPGRPKLTSSLWHSASCNT